MNWRASPWFGVVSAAFTGLLFLASLDVGPWGPLALLAPVPLLIYALSAPRAIPVALAAAGARAIGLAGIVYVYDDFPLATMLAFVAAFSLIYAGVVLLTRWLARSTPSALAVFSYPLLLVTSEFLFGMVSPHGSFGAMGYALVDVLPLLQAASLGGVPALTFCVALAPMTVALAVATPKHWRVVVSAGAIPLVLIACAGALRLNQSYESRTRVALVGLDQYEGRAYRNENEALETARAFAREVRKLVLEKPKYIVAPEKQFGGAREAKGFECSAGRGGGRPARDAGGGFRRGARGFHANQQRAGLRAGQIVAALREAAAHSRPRARLFARPGSPGDGHAWRRDLQGHGLSRHGPWIR
jgi:apolipoprotein N-acyltransferase